MLQNDKTGALVRRAKKGDREAMSELYSKTCQRVYRTILGMVHNEETAQDLTQDTYLSAFSGIQKLEDPDRFQPWVVSTAVHKAKNHLRSSKPMLFSELENGAAAEDAPDLSPESSPEISLDRKETARIVKGLMDELSAPQRLAVELYYYDQLTTPEIARSLDIPQNTVKTQLYYARKKLEAGLRRLRENGTELGGLTAIGCLGFLPQMPQEPILPPKQAEEIFSGVLSKLPKQVAARTGRQLFKGLLGKIALGTAAAAAVGGIVAGGFLLNKSLSHPGDRQPVQSAVEQASRLDFSPTQDYGDLWQILEQDYAYLPFLTAHGTDVTALRARFLAEVEQVKTPEGYFGVLRRMVENGMGMTGSLRIYAPDEFAFYIRLLRTAPEGELGEYDRMWLTFAEDPNISPLYLEALEAAPTDAQQGKYYDNAAYPTVRWYQEEKAVYIHFTHCRGDLIERDSKLVEDALAKYPEAEHLIVDIRDNNGGANEYWEQVLLQPLGGDWEWNTRGFFRNTPDNAPFYTEVECAPVSQLTDCPDWATDMGLDWYYTMGLESHSDRPETGLKRWVLTNSRTCGAGAWLAAFSKGTGWAVTVGEHTSTSVGMTGMGVLRILPESGLLLQYGDAVQTPDGTLDAETGVLPEIACDSGHALDTCLEMIRSGE